MENLQTQSGFYLLKCPSPPKNVSSNITRSIYFIVGHSQHPATTCCKGLPRTTGRRPVTQYAR